jgi:hypothetical protein
MAESSCSVRDLTTLHPGDRVEICEEDAVRFHGTVDETAPHLGVLWIRDTPLGDRLLIAACEYSIHLKPDPQIDHLQ